MLPPDLPAALYLKMQQHEAERVAKEEEKLAREQGWRASMQIDPTPPERRVYKYGNTEIKVGGRGSMMVDATVSEIRRQKDEQLVARGGNFEYPTQAPGSWEESVRDARSASLPSPVGSGRRSASRSSSKLSTGHGHNVPTNSELDR